MNKLQNRVALRPENDDYVSMNVFQACTIIFFTAITTKHRNQK